MNNEPTYTLTLTRTQAEVLETAAEVLARLGIGQFRDPFRFLPLQANEDWHKDLDRIGSILSRHMVRYIDGWRSSLGIASPDTDERAKIAYDIHQVLRHRLAWDKAVEQGIVESINTPRDWSKMVSVNYDDPLKVSDQPLPTIK